MADKEKKPQKHHQPGAARRIVTAVTHSQNNPTEQSLFLEFCLLGPRRSLHLLVDTWNEKYPDTPVGVPSMAVQSQQYNWVHRAEEYDREVYIRLVENRLQRHMDMNNRQAAIGHDMLEVAVENIQRLVMDRILGGTASVQLLKFAAEIERSALDSEVSKDTRVTVPTVHIVLTTDVADTAVNVRAVDIALPEGKAVIDME